MQKSLSRVRLAVPRIARPSGPYRVEGISCREDTRPETRSTSGNCNLTIYQRLAGKMPLEEPLENPRAPAPWGFYYSYIVDAAYVLVSYSFSDSMAGSDSLSRRCQPVRQDSPAIDISICRHRHQGGAPTEGRGSWADRLAAHQCHHYQLLRWLSVVSLFVLE